MIEAEDYAAKIDREDRVRRRAEEIRVEEEARSRVAAEKYRTALETLDSRTRRLDAFLKEPPSGLAYDIAGLLPGGGNFTLCAPKKAGKTTTMGEVIRSFTDGEPFLGRFPANPGRVAIWDYEMSDDQHRAWLAELGIRNQTNVYRLTLRGISPTFKSAEFATWAMYWLRERQIDVWLIDPAHRAFTGFAGTGDPNDAVQQFTETLEQVKEAAGVRNIGMGIHTGLNGEHARGAARWGDWPDALWTLKKDNDGTRFLSAEGRDVAMDETVLTFDRSTRRLTTPEHGFEQGSYKQSDADRLCLWLANNPGQHPSKRRIAVELSISQEKAEAAVEIA